MGRAGDNMNVETLGFLGLIACLTAIPLMCWLLRG